MQRKKFTLVFVPFLKIAVPMILGYAWICQQVYERQVLEINEEILQFWIPFVLPWIPTLLWLRPRMKLLKMNRGGRRDPDTGMSMLAAFCISIPMMMTAMYIEQASGKLESLARVNDMARAAPVRYYKFNHVFADKKNRGLYYSSYTSGRFSSTFNLEIHIVCPLYNDQAQEYPDDIGIIAPPSPDTASVKVDPSIKLTPPKALADTEVTAGYGTLSRNDYDHMALQPAVPVAWLGITYSTSMGNYAGTARKKEKEHAFYAGCVQKFNDSNVSHFEYYARVPADKHRRLYRKAALNTSNPGDVTHAIILEGSTGSFDKRTGSRLLWIFLAFGIGSFILAIVVYFVKLDEMKLAEGGYGGGSM